MRPTRPRVQSQAPCASHADACPSIPVQSDLQLHEPLDAWTGRTRPTANSHDGTTR